MGGQASSLNLDDNELLKTFCDEDVSNSDVRWDLLQQLPNWYPSVLSDGDLYKKIEQIAREIAMHSHKTERLGNIVKHQCSLIIQWAANLPEHVPYKHLGNNLYFLQQLIKVTYDTVNGEMEAAEALYAGLPKWNEIITDTLLTFITDHPLINIDPDSVSCRSLAVSCLTVLYSYPLYFASDQQEPHFFASYLVNHKDAESLVSSLLSFVSKADYSSVDIRKSSGQGNLLPTIIPTRERVRSWIRYASTLIAGSGGDTSVAISSSELTCHLGRRSALLLSILVHRNDPKSVFISTIRDEIETSQCAISILCDALSRPKALHNPDSVLLLFTMLTENPHMREHLIALPDLSRLLIPIMEQLHDLEGLWEIPSSLSVLLSVLLILSQYPSFHACHENAVLQSVPWYTDRMVSNISVGSLLVVLLVRVIKYNVANAKDMYITRLSLSVISNMGSMLTNMHEYTAQRLIQLTLFLAKKSKVDPSYAELLKNSLHCIFCSLTNNVESNIQIVYELLHHKHVWEEAMSGFDASEYGFDMQLSGIERCIEYFSDYIDTYAQEGFSSVDGTTKKLLKACQGWDPSVPAPDDQYIFEYSSDQAFFVPYSWALAVNYYSSVGLVWDESRLELLQKGGFGSQEPIDEETPTGPSQDMV
eukprot:TRINITY_DN6223_c0_g1_i1.p1 TRINITY_DN6223_c0_g1~~TRINITY_DN6223_c0_g1_i1.p1  ORF type:complete len:647 (+),score=109.30 TRINITY_DN6223_c0_g1_i1:45-1985(+)